MEISEERIIKSLSQVAEKTIVVFGDFCLDKYVYSHPDRDELSVETGLYARQFHRKKTAAGAAGTVTNNLRALGVNVLCVGAIGNDGEGWELLRALHDVGADTEFLCQFDEICTPTYMKPMRKAESGAYQEDARLDFRNFTPISARLEDTVVANLKKALMKADACIVVDQFFQRNTGVITDRVRDGLAKVAKAFDGPVLVDSRAFIYEFKETMIKCNNIELIKYFNSGEGDPEDPEVIRKCGTELFARGGKPVFVTRGAEGMLVFDDDGVTSVDAFKVSGPLDICGAGDASSAGIITGRSLGLSSAEAARLACCVSSITIQQIGTTGTASVPAVISRLKTGI